tara:strand:+ start:561 stop:842 length:282 start_codon:yes stop_codon:yes gene_type:complete
MNVPCCEEEYTQWLLSGYTDADLFMRVDESWIINNFEWINRVGFVTEVVYERDEIHGFFIRIFLGNMYADYNQYSELFPQAWEIAENYHKNKP